jgi:ATP phosphoribosyltransferase
MGSDAWLGQDIKLVRRLCAVSLFALDGVRFALSTLEDKADAVRQKRANGEPLMVAAVYPGLARKVLGEATNVVKFTDGGLEALPRVLPQLDGTFDLVESGKTAADNDLVIVEDNLYQVTLDAVWLAPDSNLVQSN